MNALSSRDYASPETYAARIRAGDVRAAARLMRFIDDRDARAVPLMRALYTQERKAHVIGLTGNPGAGKSTLGAGLVAHWRSQGKRVGVIAIDPSSPFSGGAILGDRIRMAEHSLDDAVFIRSVATRGHLGGLSASTHDLVLVMDAMGYDPILIETVGVGQDEVEVVKVADTTAVVMVPGLGDDIQALKAGILEVADLFVVNKADREGVERTERDIRQMQMLGHRYQHIEWEVPVVRTVATSRQGIADLAEALDAHQTFMRAQAHEATAPERMARARHLLDAVVRDRLALAFERALEAEGGAALLESLLLGQRDPWSLGEQLLERMSLRGNR